MGRNAQPDMLKVIFDRRMQRNTPSVFMTRILRQGVVTCLKVFYKHSWLKQNNRRRPGPAHRDRHRHPLDRRLKKCRVHLGCVADHVITRIEQAHAVALATAVDRSTVKRLVTPCAARR